MMRLLTLEIVAAVIGKLSLSFKKSSLLNEQLIFTASSNMFTANETAK